MYMYLSKGQWFLIAAAITITMLATIHNINIKKTQIETTSFKTEESILKKIEFLVSKFLVEEFKNNRSALIANIISAIDISATLSRSHGMEPEVFCICEYENTTSNILVLSFFNSTITYSLTSQDNISSTISKLEVNDHNLTIENNITIKLDLGEGYLCAYHYYRTNFCACIISLIDGDNRFVGKTLNLNWC